MKLYLAGKITNEPNFREKFARTAQKLTEQGHTVMNPAELPNGFDYEDYMHVCFAMIDVCDAVHFMPCWEESDGAKREFQHATKREKIILVEGE